jgi:quinol monooxygenase YgiN
MPTTVIARFRIKEGKEEEALERLRAMAAAVEANEPGALAYVCHRAIDDPAEVIFFEVYKDDEAFGGHMQTPHMGEMRAAFGEVFDPTQLKIERLERVGGFARAAAG